MSRVRVNQAAVEEFAREIVEAEKALPPQRPVGRPPKAEKTVSVLLRMPESLHEWLRLRMIDSIVARGHSLTIQTIALEVLNEARDRKPS